MSANPNWKRELADIVRAHNDRHAHGHKGVSFATMDERRKGIFRCFAQLRQLGYQLAPANLGGRHVEALMQYWTADPAIAALPACQRGKCAPREAPYSAAYIQKQLSFLRVYAEWIGKPGLVASAGSYARDPALVRRCVSAERDKSWQGNGVDLAAVLAMVDAADPYVGVQLALMLAFGLRRKEAVMFKPHQALVARAWLPAGLELDATCPWLNFIRVKRGTKGGRLRFTAVRSEEQRAALARACALAAHPSSHVGRPGLSLKQALARFSNVMQRTGITGKQLGVTGHGLRHQFAADLYFELTEVPPPVRGAAPDTDPEALRAAYLEVARQLGHNRPAISGAYLGAAPAPGDRSAR